jgi:hypothetical protein
VALDGHKTIRRLHDGEHGDRAGRGSCRASEPPILARHPLSDALFWGWGVRTLSRGDRGYNPIGYHTGTVWPHENAIVTSRPQAPAARCAGSAAEADRWATRSTKELLDGDRDGVAAHDALAGERRQRRLHDVERGHDPLVEEARALAVAVCVVAAVRTVVVAKR